jgi:hypothetical protein
MKRIPQTPHRNNNPIHLDYGTSKTPLTKALLITKPCSSIIAAVETLAPHKA